MNVFDFAMKMELDGKAFYEKLAQKTDVEGLKTIFSRLAADEQKHYETFQALQGKKESTVMQNSMALEEAQNVFEGLLAQKSTLGAIRGDLEGYRYAMKVEAESFRLYEDAARREKDEKVKGLLLQIAEEERQHFNILENIYNFVNAPHQFLAWGEFSNLEEFRNFGRDVDL